MVALFYIVQIKIYTYIKWLTYFLLLFDLSNVSFIYSKSNFQVKNDKQRQITKKTHTQQRIGIEIIDYMTNKRLRVISTEDVCLRLVEIIELLLEAKRKNNNLALENIFRWKQYTRGMIEFMTSTSHPPVFNAKHIIQMPETRRKKNDPSLFT